MRDKFVAISTRAGRRSLRLACCSRCRVAMIWGEFQVPMTLLALVIDWSQVVHGLVHLHEVVRNEAVWEVKTMSKTLPRLMQK